MYFATSGKDGIETLDYNKAVAYATKGKSGVLTKTDGVYTMMRFVFKDGELVETSINVNGKIQDLKKEIFDDG